MHLFLCKKETAAPGGYFKNQCLSSMLLRCCVLWLPVWHKDIQTKSAVCGPHKHLALIFFYQIPNTSYSEAVSGLIRFIRNRKAVLKLRDTAALIFQVDKHHVPGTFHKQADDPLILRLLITRSRALSRAFPITA